MHKTSKLRDFLKSLRFRLIICILVVAIVPSWVAIPLVKRLSRLASAEILSWSGQVVAAAL